ncbi:MAG: hypothetical protein ACXVPN_00405 [Bacteroidia bacterium]
MKYRVGQKVKLRTSKTVGDIVVLPTEIGVITQVFSISLAYRIDFSVAKGIIVQESELQ